MDTFTRLHLQRWADRVLFDDEREAIVSLIVELWESDPKYYADFTWSDMRHRINSVFDVRHTDTLGR